MAQQDGTARVHSHSTSSAASKASTAPTASFRLGGAPPASEFGAAHRRPYYGDHDLDELDSSGSGRFTEVGWPT